MATNFELTVTVKPSTDPSGCHLIGSDITGEVIYAANEEQTAFKRITVSLTGKASVYFFQEESNRHYSDTDVFHTAHLTIWENSSGSLALSNGISKFPFKFSLISPADKSLPASVECKNGRIRYTIEAKLVRNVENEIEAAAVQSKVPVAAIVDINRSDLLVPRAIQNDSAVNQCCFSGGVISVIASLPRSGYCISKDKINTVVKVESENAKKLTSITVSLMKKTTCYAKGQASNTIDTLAIQENTRLPRAGVSFSWNVPPIKVPETDCTLTNCTIVYIVYFIRTFFTGRCMTQQNLDLPLVLGNVTLREEGLDSFEVTQGSLYGYRPSLSPSICQYEPPPIPFMDESHSQQMNSMMEEEEVVYEEVHQDQTKKLLD